MDSDNAVFSAREGHISKPLYVFIYTATKLHTMKYFHYHSGYELYYLNSGSVISSIGNKSYNLKKGNMAIIPPYVQHRNEYSEHDKNYRMVINVSPDYLSPEMKKILESFKDTAVISFPLQYQDIITSIIKKLSKETENSAPFSQQMQKVYLLELLVHIFRYKTPEENIDYSSETLIHSIIKYINENYQNNITTAELADTFHVSESTILRKFKKYTGSKVNEYINFIRILNAEKLLMETDLSLTKIAFLCGFNDSNYFSTVFKNYKGLSPGKYLRKHKK